MLEKISMEEFEIAVQMIKVKAVTWDRLPARALKYIVKKGGELKARLFDYFKKQILKGKDSVHFTGRLIFLIKNEDKPASKSNLRRSLYRY